MQNVNEYELISDDRLREILYESRVKEITDDRLRQILANSKKEMK